MTVGDIIQNGKWNLDKISYDCPREITRKIVTMAMPINDSIPDRLRWRPTDNGLFTTKSFL